jgi:hypothetical protein
MICVNSIRKLQRRPLAEEIFFIQEPSLDFLLAVSFRFLPISNRFRVIRVKLIWQLQRRPLAEKIFLIIISIPTSYKWPIENFCLSLTVFELDALIQFGSNKNAPNRENSLHHKFESNFQLEVC